MKTSRSFLAAGLALLALGATALAETLLPTGDTYSTLYYNTAKPPVLKSSLIAGTTGASPYVGVSRLNHTFIKFDVASKLSAEGLTAADIASAKLTIYFPFVFKAGTINLHVVTSDWQETFTGKPLAEPSYNSTALGSVAASSVVAKQFASVDVTPAVTAWLKGDAQDFGFALDSPDAPIGAIIGAKEGPGSGYPATLEIEVNGTPSLFQDPNGNIGIGETPFLSGIQLVTTGSALFGEQDNAALGIDSGQGGARLGFLKKAGTEPVIASSLGAPIIFSQSNQTSVFDNIGTSTVTERMRINSNGKVGIGTTTPVTLLQVNGTITATPGSGNFAFVDDNGTANLNLGLNGSNVGLLDNTNGPLEFETSGSIHMTVATNGRVGIGTTTPASTLDVNGTITCTGFTNASDARYKMNITPISSALDKTLRLRGVSYDWNRAAFPAKGFDDRHQLGFIAQEVRPILPDVVSEDAEGYLSIGYTAIIPVLTRAIQELKEQKDTEVAALKAGNLALEQKLAALEARDQAREARLTRLEQSLDARPARAAAAVLELK